MPTAPIRFATLILLLAGTPAASQGFAALKAGLDSPYQLERERAVTAVADLLSLDPGVSAEVLPLLGAPQIRLRVGAFEALLLGAPSEEGVAEAALAAWARETDPEAAGRMARAMAGAALGGAIELPELGGARGERLKAGVADTVRGRLEELARRSVLWTDHRELGAFARLGEAAGPALVAGLADRELGASARALAALALGRLDAPGAWGRPGAMPPVLAAALEASDDEFPAEVRMALLHAATHRGIESDEAVARVARFALEEAFGAELIEAALYRLQTLSEAALRRSEPEVAAVYEEFSSPGYGEREVFGTAWLLRRLGGAERLRAAAEDLRAEEPGFAGYFRYCAVVDGLRQLGGEADLTLRRELLLWGVAPERRVPQLRAAALWYLERDGLALPEGVDRAAILAAVRASALEVHGTEVDPDFYAQRAAAIVLGLFPDEAGRSVLGRLLEHQSEAVRMMAAQAAADARARELRDRLARIARTDGEYAALGAARSLVLLGDARGLRPLVVLVGCGNALLDARALRTLRETTGRRFMESEPGDRAGWRRLSEAWKRALPEIEAGFAAR